MEGTKTRQLGQGRLSKSSSFKFWEARRFLVVGSLGLAIIQGVCATAIFLSGIGTLLGFSSAIAATVAGPAMGFHANRFRIPMLAFAGLGSVLNLALLWNAERIRNNPSARWRILPLTRKERVGKWIQFSAAILTLLLMAGEIFAHPLFHHEL